MEIPMKIMMTGGTPISGDLHLNHGVWGYSMAKISWPAFALFSMSMQLLKRETPSEFEVGLGALVVVRGAYQQERGSSCKPLYTGDYAQMNRIHQSTPSGVKRRFIGNFPLN